MPTTSYRIADPFPEFRPAAVRGFLLPAPEARCPRTCSQPSPRRSSSLQSRRRAHGRCGFGRRVDMPRKPPNGMPVDASRKSWVGGVGGLLAGVYRDSARRATIMTKVISVSDLALRVEALKKSIKMGALPPNEAREIAGNVAQRAVPADGALPVRRVPLAQISGTKSYVVPLGFRHDCLVSVVTPESGRYRNLPATHWRGLHGDLTHIELAESISGPVYGIFERTPAPVRS